MNKPIVLLVCICFTCLPVSLFSQVNGEITSPVEEYSRSRELFQQGNYAASIPGLQLFLRNNSTPELIQEAEYMLVSSLYEIRDRDCVEKLQEYLDTYPDTPHANRIYALMASARFYEEKYDEALALFNLSQLDMLGDEERDDMTYRLAISNLKAGNQQEAAIWFEVLRDNSRKYRSDAAYYVAYVRYTQNRYDEALAGFLPLQHDPKYGTLVPYYIAEIYLQQKQYDKALSVAESYLQNPSVSGQPGSRYAGEMQRILGEVYYVRGDYGQAVPRFNSYLAETGSPRRDALYMLGLSYYQTKVYSQAVTALEQVIHVNDAVTQNAYLHLGLSYLQLAERNKARMAFEQAAASNADRTVKEKAAYNYALSIHETSFSAFGESVTVFERFLNDFPNSPYTEKISSYLVETYLNTRSYEAALNSIQRITRPGAKILEAKQNILFQLGTQAFANAAFPEAIRYFDQSLALGQYNRQTQADASYWRGESYYRLDKMQEAARDFNEYLRLTRQKETEMYALAHYNLGYTAFNRKNYSQALSWFKKYIQLQKGDSQMLADAYNRVGDSYLNNRNYTEAKQFYSLAESLSAPSGDYSFYQLALVSGLQKDYAGKITILNRLLGKYPSSPYVVNAIYEKGRSYVLMNNNRQAIASFQELLSKFPESPVSRKAAAEIGLLHYQNEEYNEAIAAYKYVIQKYPGSAEARLSLRDLKSIYIDLNRVNEFASLVSTLPGNIRFDANEQDSLTYVAAEKIYMRGRVEQAKESFNRYLQTFPEGAFSLNAHHYLAVIGKEQKNPAVILQHTAKLLEYPDNPYAEQALIMRSEVQFDQFNYVEALATYNMLKEKATTPENRMLAQVGILRSAFLSRNDMETVRAANDLLSDSKVNPELINEATYYRAKAYLNQKASTAAMGDLRMLAADTRNVYGAEAKYLIAEQLYQAKEYAAAEKEILNFIEQSTPHAYWLARAFILLSDVYVAMGKPVDARQYLLSLQQNYQANDNIQGMIESRLRKLNNE